MLLILISLIAALNYSASEDIKCRMNISNLKSVAISTITVEKLFTKTDVILLKKPGQTKEEDRINYSFESNSRGDKYISASASVPSTPIKEINKTYEKAVGVLKKGENLTFNKKVIINLDKTYPCEDQDVAAMLFFIQEWFYSE